MSRTPRAFTVVELMLALVLATVVLAAMTSTVGLLASTDAISTQRLDRETDLTVAQNLLRRVFTSLASVKPLDPATANRLARQRAAAAEPVDTENAEPDENRSPMLAPDPTAPPDIAPMFDLYYVDLGGGAAAQTIDCVVIDPPGSLSPTAGRFTLEDFRNVPQGATRQGALLSRRVVQSVRGRLEVAALPPTDDDNGAPRWALQWRGLEPATPPVTLIAGITSLQWKVYPIDDTKRDTVDTLTAKLSADFPIAIHFVAATEWGETIDWMFETDIHQLGAETMEAPEPIPALPDDVHPIGAGEEDDDR